MNRHNGIVRMTLDTLAAHGITPQLRNGGKHLKIRWSDGNRTFTVVVSRSPSDRNAANNARRTLKRILKNEVSACTTRRI
jgi:hypothetical protein